MDTIHSIQQTHRETAESLARAGVKYALGSWIDIHGRPKSKVVPIDHLPNLVAGSERYTPRGVTGFGAMLPHEEECVAMPDITTLRRMPWDDRFVWMAADLLLDGAEPFDQCPRSILKAQLERARGMGYSMNLGIETELFVFEPNDSARRGGYLTPMAPSGGLHPCPAYDAEATLDAAPFLDEVVTAMQDSGFGVYSFDHEGGDGQYEFDFAFDEALAMADKMSFFRLMVRQIAKRHGLAATFMPKPYTESWGSGHHYNISLVSATSGENLMRDSNDVRGMGWSSLAYSFIAGIMKHADALAAILTPTVNSYKRLNPRLADGTASWAPVWSAYGQQNRSCMLRLPKNRPAVENRAVDSSANTYLAAAFLLAAGLDGIEGDLDPGHPVDTELTDVRPDPSVNAVRLPRNLLEATDAFAESKLAAQVFPSQFIEEYVDMKYTEWHSYHCVVTDWERDRYLTNL
ncbi:glutamine synthetase [Mycobacterium sp. JS623]|uniref:glutamine synthetase n=1 Tax=Mycobacterium sp. JS623 TaxID=212767 RepID=UPI0002A58937|nr:glutamine synthetase [Mycobacterium sp. JS623]AGB24978.1 glutamine synthetase [Mycobacterium sp. JS623]